MDNFRRVGFVKQSELGNLQQLTANTESVLIETIYLPITQDETYQINYQLCHEQLNDSDSGGSFIARYDNGYNQFGSGTNGKAYIRNDKFERQFMGSYWSVSGGGFPYIHPVINYSSASDYSGIAPYYIIGGSASSQRYFGNSLDGFYIAYNRRMFTPPSGLYLVQINPSQSTFPTQYPIYYEPYEG